MSRPRRIADAERTAAMLDLVRGIYPDGGPSLSHVVVEEVAPGTGWLGSARWADVLALGVWPSKGLTLDGYEIKASRADLRRELADLDKHRALARYCDTWTLVAWDEAVLTDGIPESWGIMLTREGAHGRELVEKRKPTKLTPEPWPRAFTCSLVRNAHQQSPGAAYVARAAVEAAQRGRCDGRDEERYSVRPALEALKKLLYGPNTWNWPKDASDPEAVMRLAVERLTQLPLAESPRGPRG